MARRTMATTLAPVHAALLLRGAHACTVGDAAAVPLEPMDALLLTYLCIEGTRARGTLRQRLLRLCQAIGAAVVRNAWPSTAAATCSPGAASVRSGGLCHLN